MLIEEDVVVNDEEALSLDELVKRPSLQCDRVARARGTVVAPRLAGIHRAGLRIQSSAGVQENISRMWIDGGAINPPYRVVLA